MRRLTVRREELPGAVTELTRTLAKPLYRGLGRVALGEYRETGTQTPHDGDLAAGCGVCLTTDPQRALSFSTGVLLITDQELLARGRTVIDTRAQGYDTAARERLDALLGPGNYDGYRLWAEVQRDDTVLSETQGHTYIARRTLTDEDFLYEVVLEGNA